MWAECKANDPECSGQEVLAAADTIYLLRYLDQKNPVRDWRSYLLKAVPQRIGDLAVDRREAGATAPG